MQDDNILLSFSSSFLGIPIASKNLKESDFTFNTRRFGSAKPTQKVNINRDHFNIIIVEVKQ